MSTKILSNKPLTKLQSSLAITKIREEEEESAGGISDDFNRGDSDSLGADWTEAAGDIDIVSNQAKFIELGFAKNLGIFSGLQCSTTNQYTKFTLILDGQSYIGLVLRYTNSSTEYYAIAFGSNENEVYWQRYPNVATGGTDMATASLTVDTGDSFGVTIEGTGDNTIVRVWRNPTANAPTSTSLWDGQAPAVTFTNNPADPVDAGTFIGIQGHIAFSVNAFVDNFYGGDVSV